MKHVNLTPELYDFVLSARSEANDPLIDELTDATRTLGGFAGMQIAPEQVTFLSLLVSALGVKRAIEIGTFTGTSAISIARGLPEDGKLLCLDRSDEWTQIARRFWVKAGVDHKIELRIGDGKELLAQLGDESFDFAFIDADKGGYDAYYEAILPRLRPGGVILFDNMLRDGRVADPQNEEDHALRNLNLKLAADSRVQAMLLPIADGLNMARKK